MRNDILKALGKTPAADTISKIADVIGYSRAEIATELNRMRASDLVDRKKEDPAAEFTWWLRDEGKKALAALAPVREDLIPEASPCCGAAGVILVTASDGLKTLRAENAAIKDEAARNNAALLDRIADLQSANESWQKATAEIENKWIEANNRIEDLQSTLAAERIARASLREQLENVTQLQAAGYLVKAPKRKPRLCSKEDSAKAAAMAAARNGSGKGEVFALIKVGKAVRGAEWQQEVTA